MTGVLITSASPGLALSLSPRVRRRQMMGVGFFVRLRRAQNCDLKPVHASYGWPRPGPSIVMGLVSLLDATWLWYGLVYSMLSGVAPFQIAETGPMLATIGAITDSDWQHHDGLSIVIAGTLQVLTSSGRYDSPRGMIPCQVDGPS
mgnify:CR=1 FL=1